MDFVKPADRLILGHMPFVGISYQSGEMDEEYRKRFSDASEVERVLDAAMRMGVRRFAAATPDSSPLAPLHLKVLRYLVDDGHKIELVPCIGLPLRIGGLSVDDYRRWATYLAVEEETHQGVRRRILEDPVLNFREGWVRRLLASKPYGDEDFLGLTIDWALIESRLEPFLDLPVACMEPGSETDFLAIAGRHDLIGELIDRMAERGFSRILLGVHHAGVTIPRLDEVLGGFDGYVTPLNSIGVMMFPTKGSAEDAVRRTKKGVYAIKPLAGGRVEPREAFNYVFGLGVEGCMFGAGSVKETEEDIRAAVEVINGLGHEVGARHG